MPFYWVRAHRGHGYMYVMHFFRTCTGHRRLWCLGYCGPRMFVDVRRDRVLLAMVGSRYQGFVEFWEFWEFREFWEVWDKWDNRVTFGREEGERINNACSAAVPIRSRATGSGGWGVDGAPRPVEGAGSNPRRGFLSALDYRVVHVSTRALPGNQFLYFFKFYLKWLKCLSTFFLDCFRFSDIFPPYRTTL